MAVTLSVRTLRPDDVAQEGVSITRSDGTTLFCTHTSDDEGSSYYWVWKNATNNRAYTTAITGLTTYQD